MLSCADGSPRCPLRGAGRTDVAGVLGAKALGSSTARYHRPCGSRNSSWLMATPTLRSCPGDGVHTGLAAGGTDPQGAAAPHPPGAAVLRPLSRVGSCPCPTCEASVSLCCSHWHRGVTWPLPLPGGLRHGGAGAWRCCTALTLLLLYEPTSPAGGHMLMYLPRPRPMWQSWSGDSPVPGCPGSACRQLHLTTAPHGSPLQEAPAGQLFLLAGPDTVLTPDLNRCRMHAICGWQAFFPMHFQAFHPAVAPPQGPDPRTGAATQAVSIAGRPPRPASFPNSDYVAAQARLAASSDQEGGADGEPGCVRAVLRFSSLPCCGRWSQRCCSASGADVQRARLREDLYHRCRQSALESLGSARSWPCCS